MKRTLGTLLMALGSMLAHAELSEAEVEREIAYSAFHALDWAQTRSIARAPGQWKEFNPVLGSHPSRARVDVYFVSTLAAHWLIASALPRPLREPFQLGTLALEVGIVHNNYRIGIGMRF